jgi:hypothetical protein
MLLKKHLAKNMPFTPNIFGILCWAFVVFIMSLPDAFRRDADAIKYKYTLAAILSFILLIWTILNDYSEMLRPFKKWFISVKIISYLVIPLIVVVSVVQNGIFQMRLSGINSHLSCIPIIFQMYLIICLHELVSYLKRKHVHNVKLKIVKKSILSCTIVLLALLNIWFCMYFFVSWGDWMRTIKGVPLN